MKSVVTEFSITEAGHYVQTEWVKLAPQPDRQTIVVKCDRCGASHQFKLPSGMDEVVRWLDDVQAKHKDCPPRST